MSDTETSTAAGLPDLTEPAAHVAAPLIYRVSWTASWRRGAGVLALFLALTVLFTWPQALQMRTGSVAHQDPLFSAWRLAWVSHALFTDAPLFDGNIMYPAHRTLAFSDAMLLQGLIAAPFIRAGVPPLLMVNLLWFISLIASAGGMYLLARRLTGSTSGAIVAAIIFTFAPYRAEHFMHLELNWAQWIPLTLWAVHRALTEDRMLDGVLAGAFIALQLLSCIYYAIYLLLVLAIVGVLSLWAYRRQFTWRALAGFALGGVVIAMVAIPYSKPYQTNTRTVGTRAEEELSAWSATPASYVSATPENLLYGRRTGQLGGPEARDFPGIVAVVLLVIALLPPFNATRLIYFLALAFAVECSFGTNGTLYPILFHWLKPLQGLRAPGRMGIFVLVALGVLAAYGFGRLQTWVQPWLKSPALRVAFPVIVCAVIGLEYKTTPLQMWKMPTKPPSIYEWLKGMPHPTLTLEFPMLDPDPFYMYFSTMHWQPLMNGYSGFRTPFYLDFAERFHKSFPNDYTMQELRNRGVKAIIVHKEMYQDQKDYARVITGLAFRTDVHFVASWRDIFGEARAYLVPPDGQVSAPTQ
jgi:hypothetical protein